VANATRTPPRVLVTKMRSSNCRAIIRQWKKAEQGCSWRVGPTNRWRIYWEGIGESSGAGWVGLGLRVVSGLGLGFGKIRPG